MPFSTKKSSAVAAEQQNIAASGAMGSANANLPGPAPFTAGPHRHDILNKLDPSVDSATGGMQVLAPAAHGTAAAAGAPLHGGNAPYSNRGAIADPAQPSAGNYYAMGTNVVPGSASAPRNAQGSASAPRNAQGSAYGPHTSRLANAADPRVESDADRRRRVGAGAGAASSSGSRPIFPPGVGGPAPTTAGPHRHDILNKLDPTVDSKSAATVDATGRRVY